MMSDRSHHPTSVGSDHFFLTLPSLWFNPQHSYYFCNNYPLFCNSPTIISTAVPQLFLQVSPLLPQQSHHVLCNNHTIIATISYQYLHNKLTIMSATIHHTYGVVSTLSLQQLHHSFSNILSII